MVVTGEVRNFSQPVSSCRKAVPGGKSQILTHKSQITNPWLSQDFVAQKGPNGLCRILILKSRNHQIIKFSNQFWRPRLEPMCLYIMSLQSRAGLPALANQTHKPLSACLPAKAGLKQMPASLPQNFPTWHLYLKERNRKRRKEIVNESTQKIFLPFILKNRNKSPSSVVFAI
jgi:hypothetical protein